MEPVQAGPSRARALSITNSNWTTNTQKRIAIWEEKKLEMRTQPLCRERSHGNRQQWPSKQSNGYDKIMMKKWLITVFQPHAPAPLQPSTHFLTMFVVHSNRRRRCREFDIFSIDWFTTRDYSTASTQHDRQLNFPPHPLSSLSSASSELIEIENFE